MTDLPLETTCQAVKQSLDQQGDFLLLDCREPDEHELVHIDGATLLPMSQLMERHSELAPHQQRSIVVYCHHGQRSLQVAHWLRGQGYSQAQSMTGGIDAWAVEIEPGMERY